MSVIIKKRGDKECIACLENVINVGLECVLC